MTIQRLFARSLAALAAPSALCLISAAQMAQAQTPAPLASPDFSVTPRNGQSAQQQSADNSECQGWATGQTGFDAQRAGGSVPPADYPVKRAQFARAMGACLEAHGYTVHYSPSAAAAAPSQAYAPPAPPPYYGYSGYTRSSPSLAWSPVHVHADAGYSIVAGDAGTYLDDGPTFGLGASLFPVESIPVGLRIDGTYSHFPASDALLDSTNASYGHEDTYGGDVDLQVNFPFVWNQQFYVFGGIGWYREQTVLRQVSLVDGGYCDFYYGCGYPVQTAEARYTTSWHDAWNSGIGWEMALANHLSLFVEASYLRIRPNSDGQQFVPIRVGVRF